MNTGAEAIIKALFKATTWDHTYNTISRPSPVLYGMRDIVETGIRSDRAGKGGGGRRASNGLYLFPRARAGRRTGCWWDGLSRFMLGTRW